MLNTAIYPYIRYRQLKNWKNIMSSLINYYLAEGYDFKELIKKSMIAGALQASGYQSNTKKTYLKYIEKLSKRIKIKVINYNA